MNKHSHIYLYTFIHSGMTVEFTANGTVSSSTRSEATDGRTPRRPGPFISSTVTSSTDLGWRNVVNMARRSAAISSGLTAAYDQLSLTAFDVKTPFPLNFNMTRQENAHANRPEVRKG